ncbi:MAG: ACT domain-containing protein [Peptoniphilus sp.]|uniref:UPF0237 protein HMPREF9129_1571 n=2 Tax=Peptoniphilus indolicus TaxID=33030 RepID=G4D591_9FIRM|nr:MULTISPECIES: ACT domain-containing protein [Peptoniphilus]EGY79309.1 ACT domain protein [Peptoniphilus indolicus ATCC 29427]MDY2987351.1 ACT domain-containing protein [Peptoniphilus sp.]SUB74305.1 ACT domain-containing protein [Peptoniphilus indolicus]
MKAILTIIGKDFTGIVYRTSELLVKYNINILDINQTIMDDKFTAMMMVDLTNANTTFTEVVEGFDKLGEEIGVYIKIQNEDIFNKMHRI